MTLRASKSYGLALMPRRAIVGGLWLGTGAGLGFMAKGLFAPGVLAVAAAILFVGCRAWRRRATLSGAAIAMGAIAPWLLIWPIALHAQSGEP